MYINFRKLNGGDKTNNVLILLVADLLQKAIRDYARKNSELIKALGVEMDIEGVEFLDAIEAACKLLKQQVTERKIKKETNA